MSKEGSVAPKERVNITYKPAIGNAKEEIELWVANNDGRRLAVGSRSRPNCGQRNFAL